MANRKRERPIGRRKKSFTGLVRIWGLVFLVTMGASIATIDVLSSCRDFGNQAAQMRTEYIEEQKETVRQEVHRVLDMIEHEKAQSTAIARDKTKARVYEAHALAQDLYEQYKGKQSPEEIQQTVVDVLRSIRFEGGAGYYFAVRLDGFTILNAGRPELERRYQLAEIDPSSQLVIQDMIEIARQSGEGFYEYDYSKPSAEGNQFKKVSFVKRFEPYDWVIGTGLYVDDVEREIQAQLLERISTIRFGREGYVFVNTMDGDTLVSNGRLLSGKKKLWEIFERDPAEMKAIHQMELEAAQKPGGDFIEYSHFRLTEPNRQSPKISFIQGIPGWGWIVGAGVYLDDVEADVLALQNELNRQLRRKVLYSLLVTIGIVGVSLLIFQGLNRRLRHDFRLFVSFFEGTAHSHRPIDRDLVHFEELDRMAGNANKMLSDRSQAEKALQQSEARLRELSCDWIWEVNTNSVFIYASPQVKAILGYLPEEVIGRPLSGFVPPEEAGRASSTLQHVLNSGETLAAFEGPAQHRDGRIVVLETSGVPMLNASGEVIGYRGVSRDVTERKRTEEALEFERAQLLSIFDSIDEVVYVSDPVTYEILYVNRAAEETLQREQLGRICYEAIQQRDRPCDFCTNDIILEQKPAAYRWEYHNPTIGRDFAIIDRIIRWPDGRDVRFELAIDITERKRAERELIHQTEMRKILFNISSKYINIPLEEVPRAIQEALEEVGQFVAADRACSFEYDFENNVMTTTYEWTNEGIPPLREELRRVPLADTPDWLGVHRRGEPVYVPDVEALPPCSLRENLELQEIRSLIAMPMLYKSELLGFVGFDSVRERHEYSEREISVLNLFSQVLVNIQMRVKSEVELRRLRNYLSNIIDSMPSVLVGVDSGGTITQWNAGAQRATGVEVAEALGKPLTEAFPRLQVEMARVREAMKRREVLSNHRQQRYEDGETVYEDVTVYPLTANGIEGAVIRLDDVTERVRLEEMMVQSEKMLSVGGLAAGMAHEINNPLAGMMQTASVLASRLAYDLPVNAEAARKAGTTMEVIRAFMEAREVPEMLAHIHQSGSRAAKIVLNMLSFARKSDSTFTKQGMVELLEQSIELAGSDYDLKKHSDFRQIEILREYEEGLPAVPCEAPKIQQVFLNILRNGAEAMQEKRGQDAPQFILRLAHEREEGMVRIEIEDNGPGMDETTRRRVFEPFFTTKPTDRGTGLGLSVSYFIITENHHGRMGVESAPGEGTRFIIYLPTNEREA